MVFFCSDDSLNYFIIIIVIVINVWFWILLVTEFKLLDGSGYFATLANNAM